MMYYDTVPLLCELHCDDCVVFWLHGYVVTWPLIVFFLLLSGYII